MTARQGPGGRIPNQGRGPQAKGVGKNAKRHDLERPKTPGLADSDLQQGDVQALEQGQRIAPVQRQSPATPSPPSGGGGAAPSPRAQSGDPTGAMDIAKRRLGGTIGQRKPEASVKDIEKARGWSQFFAGVARNPAASSGMRLKARQNAKTLASTFQGPTSNTINLAQADDDIEAFLNSKGF